MPELCRIICSYESSVNHVKMEVNGVAHRLAKKVLFLMDEQIHMEEGSHCILDIVTADFLRQ
jgi:hypothetical protein